MTIHPIVGMLLVGAGFAVLIAGLHALRKAREPGPELLRKLLHIGMGIISVALPRLFDASWPVLFLAGLFVLGLAGGRFVPCWRHLADGVIYGVRRTSVGDICFPIGVAAVFLVSAGDPVTFSIPILIMTFADSVAALVGRQCGVHRVGRPGSTKTLEGSAAFFFVGLACICVPLWCCDGRGKVATLLLSLNVALAATLVEALSASGLDNLTVPLAVAVLLRVLGGLKAGGLGACLVAIAAVLVLLAHCHGRGPRGAAAAPEVVHESV